MDPTPENLLEKLKQGLALVETLRKENEQYKVNFEQLSCNFENLQQKHERVSKEFITISKEKDVLLSDLNTQKQKYTQKLAEKEKELQQVKEKPLDVELLKLELLKQLEHQQASKFQVIEQECSKFRSLYYKVKREWDSSRSDYDIKIGEVEQEKRKLIQQHQLDIANLESKIAMLQAAADDCSELERLRIATREKNELELRAKELVSELDQVRAEKEDLRLTMETEARNFKRQLADYITESKTFQSEKESLASRLLTMEDELRVTNRRKDEAVEESNRLKKEFDKVVSKLEEQSHQYTMDQQNASLLLIKAKTEYENQMELLKSKVDSLQMDLKLANELQAELKEKLGSQEREYLDKLRLSREEDWAKISLVETEKHELEKQLSTLKQRHADMEAKFEQLQKECDGEVERLKADLRDSKTSVEQLQTETKDLTLAREHLTMLVEKSKQKQVETQSQMMQATSTIDSLNSKISQSNETISNLETKNRELEKQMEEVNSRLEREIEAYEHTIERQLLKYQQGKQKYTTEVENLNRDHLRTLEKLKMSEDVIQKQQEMFETKFLMLKEKLRIYKTESGDAKRLLQEYHVKEQQRQEMVM